MLASSQAFSSFAIDDLGQAMEFYGQTLGVDASVVDEQNGLMSLKLSGDRDVMLYVKGDYEPATYTVLNFRVDDVEATVRALTDKGVAFERYDGFDQDELGIARGFGPTIAWFKDPAGNILSVLSDG